MPDDSHVREFQSTMHFLLGFVKKDKQADGLAERLLVRLGLAQGAPQRRALAFCLAELPASPKGLKKMLELFKHIKDAATDAQVGLHPSPAYVPLSPIYFCCRALLFPGRRTLLHTRLLSMTN